MPGKWPPAPRLARFNAYKGKFPGRAEKGGAPIRYGSRVISPGAGKLERDILFRYRRAGVSWPGRAIQTRRRVAKYE